LYDNITNLSKSSDSCLSNSQPNKFDTAGYESDQDEDDKLSDEEESLQHLGFEEERQLPIKVHM
jgi:hypothetical protein